MLQPLPQNASKCPTAPFWSKLKPHQPQFLQSESLLMLQIFFAEKNSMKLNEKTYIWFLTEKDATDQLKKKLSKTCKCWAGIEEASGHRMLTRTLLFILKQTATQQMNELLSPRIDSIFGQEEIGSISLRFWLKKLLPRFELLTFFFLSRCVSQGLALGLTPVAVHRFYCVPLAFIIFNAKHSTLTF